MGRVASWDEHLAAHPMPRLMPMEGAESRSDGLGDDMGIVARREPKSSGASSTAPEAVECTRTHYLPTGWSTTPGKTGVYWVADTEGTDAPF